MVDEKCGPQGTNREHKKCIKILAEVSDGTLFSVLEKGSMRSILRN
jgi:hypothetical protein